MKKIIILIFILTILVITISACNTYVKSEDTHKYNALIMLDGKTIYDGPIEDYMNYSSGNVSIKCNGKLYNTHKSNVVITEY